MDSPQGNFSDVPVLDISGYWAGADARAELAQRLADICHHVGFVVVSQHRVAQTTIDTAFDASARLFALPLEDKLLIDKRRSPHFRGWEAEGAEYTNNRPDIREQVDLWSEHPVRPPGVGPEYLRLLGPNQWLPESVLPGFRDAVSAWLNEVEPLANALMELFALGLELPPDTFDKMFGDERMSLSKLIRYPATPPGQFGVNAHHDTGFLTILAPGTTPGLEIQNADGEWIPVPVLPQTLVVNLGEILQAITGNYFIATAHRVRTQQPRQSMGYFHGPALGTELNPLALAPHFRQAVALSPRHQNAGYMAQRRETLDGVEDMQSPHHPQTYGEQLWNYFARSYPENMAMHYPDAV